MGRETEILAGVRAPLAYLVPTGQRPFSYTFDPPAGRPRRGGAYEDRLVDIRDGRPLLPALSVDIQGFTLEPHASAVRDFYDEGEVRGVYFPEAEALVRRVTGATRAVAFDFNLRNRAKQAAGEPGIREPVTRVHNDFTETSGPDRLRRELGEAEADRLLKDRFAIINIWRPIRGPVEESPLAVCDASSIAPGDVIGSDLIYRDRVGETYAFAYNPRHRWYYFPRMTRDEALFIKGYDSDPARARFTAHTAFTDPGTPAGAPARESIEVRLFAFFGA